MTQQIKLHDHSLQINSCAVLQQQINHGQMTSFGRKPQCRVPILHIESSVKTCLLFRGMYVISTLSCQSTNCASHLSSSSTADERLDSDASISAVRPLYEIKTTQHNTTHIPAVNESLCVRPSIPNLVLHVHLRMMLKQQLHDRRLSLISSEHQCRPSILRHTHSINGFKHSDLQENTNLILHINLCIVLQQQCKYRPMATLSSKKGCCPSRLPHNHGFR